MLASVKDFSLMVSTAPSLAADDVPVRLRLETNTGGSHRQGHVKLLESAPIFREETPTDGPMRIFLIQSAHGLYASSGGYRSNVSLACAMRSKGHIIKMLAYVYPRDLLHVPHSMDEPVHFAPGRMSRVYRFTFNGIDVVALNVDDFKSVFLDETVASKEAAWLENTDINVPEYDARQAFIHREMDSFKPTHILMNDHVSLKVTMDDSIGDPPPARIFIVHDSPYQRLQSWKRLRDVEGLWTVSKAVQKYFAELGNLDSIHLPNHPLIYGDIGSIPFYDNFDAPYIGAINPGMPKGFPIVHGIATNMPGQAFLVVKSWSMTEHLVNEYRKLANIKIVDAVTDMEALWRLIKILLVPSIWFEAFGLVVVEALLRGIPVITSDAGGLPEAHLGVPYIIPVSKFTGEREKDPAAILRNGIDYKIPVNDVRPWVEVTERLAGSREEYKDLRRQGRDRALAYVCGQDSDSYERWMREASRKVRL
ncbi:hypothetical protein HK104_001058 [Borealophlyctis nickersoniae]|nr:hypothetical protein HK104_001058 [Borealophlyctis nickersoniae]